ncbi:hypothetical protein [uncultured Lacinutrix sp.]|uniref:hypothetical protein n=1 Tax=uncultured Lacinutrix sp. TaxID=574032 RepID=UPI00260C2D86|nr:hypothetical protein [uncultured Lacinutrix sp.]
MKNLQNLGKALSKSEQKTINGGTPPLLGCQKCDRGWVCDRTTGKCEFVGQI